MGQLKRSGIPIFFSFNIVTLKGVFHGKMVKIDDDVFLEKRKNVIWSKYFDHDIYSCFIIFCADGWPKNFIFDFSVFSNMFANKNNRGSRFFGKRKGKEIEI